MLIINQNKYENILAFLVVMTFSDYCGNEDFKDIILKMCSKVC